MSGKAYLDTELVAQMDGLHEHIQFTGRMEGYPVPPPSCPVDTSISTSAIALREWANISLAFSNMQCSGCAITLLPSRKRGGGGVFEANSSPASSVQTYCIDTRGDMISLMLEG